MATKIAGADRLEKSALWSLEEGGNPLPQRKPPAASQRLLDKVIAAWVPGFKWEQEASTGLPPSVVSEGKTRTNGLKQQFIEIRHGEIVRAVRPKNSLPFSRGKAHPHWKFSS